MAVLTDIITELKAQIDAMTTAGGFNYNYDNVDERRPGSKTYPNVMVEFPEDEPRNRNANTIDSYSIDQPISFIVTVSNLDKDSNPVAVDTALDNVKEDFERLLEAIHSDLQDEGLIVEDMLESDREYTHVRKRPGKTTINFNFFYRVRRSNPSLTI